MRIKTSSSFPMLILFYIFLLFSSLTRSTPVLDTDGNELQSNTKYNVFPLETGNGGGLALSPRDRRCPFYVMQENNEASNGLSLKFLPADNKLQVVNSSTDVNIVFMAATICVQSTAWRLGGVDAITGRRYVVSGGVVGRQGFKIEKYGNGYKIVWCPTSVCGNVGVFVENDRRWLGLNDVPLVVVFKKSSN